MIDAQNVISFKAEAYPIRLVKTRAFFVEAALLFSREELVGFLNYISANPHMGTPIPGVVGLRKISWNSCMLGRRQARIIYFFRDLNMPLFLVAIYANSERVALSKAEMQEISEKLSRLVTGHAFDMPALLTA